MPKINVQKENQNKDSQAKTVENIKLEPTLSHLVL